MKSRSRWKSFLLLQLLLAVGFAAAVTLSPVNARSMAKQEFLGQEPFVEVAIPRTQPHRVQPFYNRPDLISDADLAAVLEKIQPPFARHEMKPNHVEHALRTWGVTATFQNPHIVSGQEMLEFLTDNGKYVASWGTDVLPLLEAKPTGVAIRWGTETGASYHHDHWLACVTEAGAPLSTPVFAPGRSNATLYNVVQESLRDFRLDEREVEWTAMAFGLWIAPTREWIGEGGRQYSFDLLVDRLMRGQKEKGVCSGTHRVYSLMLLVRLDDEFDILSDAGRSAAYGYLESVRDAIMVSQFEDGHWPSNWPDGANAVLHPVEDALHQQVITTGHHLEWLSIAPPDLHPPEAQIKKAMDWVVATTKAQTQEQITGNYTFFSHVGFSVANWRQVHPADFWRAWEAEHPLDLESAFDPNAGEVAVAPEAGH